MFLTSNHITQYCALLSLVSLLAIAAEPAPPSEGGMETRSLYVTVEKDGGLVQGLLPGNFRVYEEGDLVPIKLAAPEKPASIALLVEYSEASWYYFRDIVRAMEGFMDSAPSGHWYALATFARELSIEVDFTKRRGRIANAFGDLRAPMWDATDTFDALYRMLDIMGRLPGRRILIFIGSGFDTFSSRTQEDVRKKLESVNVTVFAAGAGSELRGSYEPYLSTSTRMELMRARAFLQMLADKSGGQAWFPRFESAFPDVMEGIMQTILHQYKIVYQPPPPAGEEFHEIEVQAFVVRDDQRQDFDVRVRDGWRSGLR